MPVCGAARRVASTRLPHLRGEDELSPLLERVSAWLRGEQVQGFASIPRGDYQAWAMAESGRRVRSFYYFGAEDAWKELVGKLYTKEELDMVLKYRDEFRAKKGPAKKS